MRGSTHALVGVASGIAIATMVNSEPLIVGVCAFLGGIGGLIPDIDHVRSKLGQKIIPVSFLLQNTVGHRTVTHSIIFIGLCVIIGSQFPNVLARSVVAGIVLHIVCDALTPNGVPLLYPHPMRFRVPLLWRIRPLTETATLLASVAIIVLIVYG